MASGSAGTGPLLLCSPSASRLTLPLLPNPQVLERRGVASGSEDEGGSTAGGANGRDAAAPHKSKSTSALPAGGAQQAQQRTGGLAAAAKAALRGVEPELFNPEDLLAATGGLGPGAWQPLP